MNRKLLLPVLIALMSCQAFGQQYLALYKSGSSQKYLYKKGEAIRIITHDAPEAFFASLDEIGNTWFMSGMDTIYFDDIKSIYLPETEGAPRGLLMMGKVMQIGGFGMVLLDLVNQAIIDEPFKENTGLWITGTGIGVLGLLPSLIKRKKRKVKGLWKLQPRYTTI